MDKRVSPKGKALSVLGHFNPALKDKPAVFESEKIKEWISKGAKPSSSAASLLKKHGFADMDRFLVMKKHQRKKKGEEETKTAPPSGAAPAAEAKPA